MRIPYRILCVVLLSLCCLALSGCSNREELGNVSVITGFFLDFSPYEQTYCLLAESIDFSNYERTSALSSQWLEGNGKSLSEAFFNLQKKAPKPLYFSHAKIILLGKDFPQDSIAKTVDFLYQNPDINPDILFAVTDASKEKLTTGSDQPICKNVFELLQKENTVSDAKLYRLFSKKEFRDILPRITLYQTGTELSGN